MNNNNNSNHHHLRKNTSSSSPSKSKHNSRPTKLTSNSRNSNILHRFRLRNNKFESKIDDFLDNTNYNDDDDNDDDENNHDNDDDKDHDEIMKNDLSTSLSSIPPNNCMNTTGGTSMNNNNNMVNIESTSTSPFSKKGLKRFIHRSKIGGSRSQYESLDAATSSSTSHSHNYDDNNLTKVHYDIGVKDNHQECHRRQESNNPIGKSLVLNEINNIHRKEKEIMNGIQIPKKKRKSLDYVEGDIKSFHGSGTSTSSSSSQSLHDVSSSSNHDFVKEGNIATVVDDAKYCESDDHNEEEEIEEENNSLLKKSRNLVSKNRCFILFQYICWSPSAKYPHLQYYFLYIPFFC